MGVFDESPMTSADVDFCQRWRLVDLLAIAPGMLFYLAGTTGGAEQLEKLLQ